jgi:hypothetical protein
MPRAMQAMITRNNYGEFCVEAPLSQIEQREWCIMAEALRAERHRDSPDSQPLYLHITSTVTSEYAAYRAASIATTRDWSDMVLFADSCRQLKRAEIAAWHEYQRAKT